MRLALEEVQRDRRGGVSETRIVQKQRQGTQDDVLLSIRALSAMSLLAVVQTTSSSARVSGRQGGNEQGEPEQATSLKQE